MQQSKMGDEYAGIHPRHPLALSVSSRDVLLWAMLFIALFGYEMFNFSLSIDEEFHTFDTGWPVVVTWLQQGRWGMSLLMLLFPPVSALPVVSTAVFGAGLIWAAVHLVAFYRIQGLQAHVFALVLMVSPVWPHIVQFNQVSWGVGVGVLLCAMGIRLLADARVKMQILGVGMLTLAIGIYPVLVFAAVVVVLGRYLVWGSSRRASSVSSVWSEVTRIGLLVCISQLLSLAIQYAGMKAMGVGFTYVGGYWRISEYLTNPTGAFLTAVRASVGWIFGLNPIYMGYGLAFVFVPFLGLVFAILKRHGEEKGFWILRALSVLTVFVAVLLPIFIAVGAVPARALVALPFMFAVFAACVPLPVPLAQRAMSAYLVVLLILGMWVSATLFYSDHVMRERDQILAIGLMEQLQDLREPGQPLQFTLVGKLEPAPREPVRRVEVFGASFFDWDQGNVFRVHAFLRILGVYYLKPIDIAQLPEVASKAEAMPAWPAPGSVALLDDVAVIKLSPMTYEQRHRLGAANPGHPLGLPKDDSQPTLVEGDQQ